jgi:hypothetical protein
MNTLTLKIPDDLATALQTASRKRQISKSAVVRDALSIHLATELKQSAPAINWVNRWRGVLAGPTANPSLDEREAHILNKHLR